jgi:signal transduction histidine kinase
MKTRSPQINFVVGEERRLSEIISRTEIEPLLRSLVKAGPAWAAVIDEDGLPLARQGVDAPLQEYRQIRHDLIVEAEPRGTLVMAFDPLLCPGAESLALLVRDALQLTVTNNLKRMLTTEMHTTVVQESYDQLVETNRQLLESEGRYRELALELEHKVEERTAELQKVYSRMLQQEKLAAVGSLAAGMAHEINNPNGFVRSNLETFGRYFQKMKEAVQQYQLLIADNTPLPQLKQETENKRRELKLDFIFADTRDLLEQSIAGSDRIARIVADLKSFSHVDESGFSDVDLNDELERTLTVMAPQIAMDTVIERNLQPMPLLGCNPGLMSQAFFNIIQNALLSRETGLELKIASRMEGGEIVIEIMDNGCGIPADQLSRVFEPFFTTREVGSGTGMGLTVAREIVRSVGGSIEIVSAGQGGTTATMRLPLAEGKR